MAAWHKPKKPELICPLEHRCEANGKDNKGRVMREYYARLCENLGLKYRGLLDNLKAVVCFMNDYYFCNLFDQLTTNYGRKILKMGLVLLIIVLPYINTCSAQSKTHPNIVVIVPDDLGWADAGYNGSSIKTPNIDRLAESGVKLTQQYVMTTCTPTRVGLLTGRYPSRYGVTSPAYGEVIPKGTSTIASLLKSKGYFTAIDGKWHVGSPPYTPLKYGFQSSYGYFDGQIDPYTHNYKMETAKTKRKSWNRNDEYLDEDGHATDLITDEAVRIINEKKQDPFFLYVAYSVPHAPLDEPKKWTSKYENIFTYPSRRWFAASVTHMDAGIGRIMDALEETGQRDNTLLLFMSDNGGQKSWYSKTQYRGRYADKPHKVLGNNFPLRGWKTELKEGGIRVPALINWRGTLKPKTIKTPTNYTDWLPTFMALTGSKQEELKQLHLDGKNIWPLLNGTAEEENFEKRAMYWKSPDAFAVRKGSWKLLVHKGNDKVGLYNLKSDFRENHDLSDEKPEKVQQLKALLTEFKHSDK